MLLRLPVLAFILIVAPAAEDRVHALDCLTQVTVAVEAGLTALPASGLEPGDHRVACPRRVLYDERRVVDRIFVCGGDVLGKVEVLRGLRGSSTWRPLDLNRGGNDLLIVVRDGSAGSQVERLLRCGRPQVGSSREDTLRDHLVGLADVMVVGRKPSFLGGGLPCIGDSFRRLVATLYLDLLLAASAIHVSLRGLIFVVHRYQIQYETFYNFL